MVLSALSKRLTGKSSPEDCDVLPAFDSQLTPSIEDGHVTERIKRALRKTGYGVLRSVAVSVNDRVVRLVGQVPSYYMKQVAQATALAVPGAHQIRNDLVVIPST